MEIREGLLYAKSHEWVKEEGDVVTIGLTDYAQSELGDLVFVNLPEEGDRGIIIPIRIRGICSKRAVRQRREVYGIWEAMYRIR